jgi:proline dehydrogenase
MPLFNNLIVSITEKLPKPIIKQFAKKYIAGESLEQAVNLIKKLNAAGIYATIDVLGESIKSKEEANRCKINCEKVLDSIREKKLNSNLSIKPTQMGLNIDENFAYYQINELVEKAKEENNFVRLDMENSPFTEKTINIYKKLKSNYDNVGIVLQAYLKRTYDDVRELCKTHSNFRLCKGIYIESEKIAYKDRQMIRDNYLKCLEFILNSGSYVGIATHDDYLINRVYDLIEKLDIPKSNFEFQMLLGVREELRNKINSDGYKIRVYVPFGSDWYAYSIRRLQENPQVARYIFNNLFDFTK